jgi:hypothetical protein
MELQAQHYGAIAALGDQPRVAAGGGGKKFIGS